MYQNAGINKAILVGNIDGKANWQVIDNEKCLCLKLVTKETINKQNIQQEHLEYHIIRIPECVVGQQEDEFKDGYKIYLEGKVQTRSSVDGMGIKRYDTSILVNRYSLMETVVVQFS